MTTFFIYFTENSGNSIISQLLAEYKSSLTSKLLNVKKETQKNNNNNNVNCMSKKQGNVQNLSFRKVDVQEILKKSVITPDFEKLHSVPMYDVADKKLREQRRVSIEYINLLYVY